MADQAARNALNAAIAAHQDLQAAVTGLLAAIQAFQIAVTVLPSCTSRKTIHVHSILSQLNCNNKEHRKSHKEMT